MMNLIRADFYRISKGWVVYVPFAALLLLHVIMIAGSLIQANVPADAGGVQYLEQALSFTQLFFLICVIPFVFCVSVPSFSDGTMKNDIAWGMSRIRLYVSKLLVLMALTVLLYVFYIGSGMAIATAFFGFGNATVGFWGNLLQAMGAQMVAVLAVCSLMMFLSFLLKKPYVLTEALAGILIIPMVINWISSIFNVDASWVLYFDLISTIERFASFSLLDGRAIGIAFGVITVWMIAPSAAGIALLRKAEIK